ncbi:MAG: hypothetical protein BWY44_01246 [Candidatus Omnitrophica bacterium ADurb.Bin292]|nr:MAG: hypothetical protein BWY44_01246 [Candidatus Omnitrophica bacterium ADurb.Bin292]
MSQRMVVVLSGAILFCLLSAGGLQAENYVSDKDESVKKMGVAWNIAEDRMIANYAGVYQPEGLDVYMKRHFDLFTAKLDQLSAEINQLQKKVDSLMGKGTGTGGILSSGQKS